MKIKSWAALLFAFFLSVAVATTGFAAQPAEGYDPEDGIYVKAESEYYYNGRYSNGRVFPEYLAKELTGDYDNLTNYAVGGAFSGVLFGTEGSEDERSNYSTFLKGWSADQQVKTFLAEHNGKIDPDALYIISVGGNDGYAVEDLGVDRTAELASDFSLKMVQNLLEGGARYILLPNRYEDDRKGLTEFEDIRNQQTVQKINDYLALDSTPDDVHVLYGHNQQLKENIDEQGFEKFGYKSMGFYLISDWVPAYGYAVASEDNSDVFPTTENEETYGGYGLYSTDSKYYTPETAGFEPNDFYLYDEYHVSNKTHRHMAAYLLNTDIETEDGQFKNIYNGEPNPFAEALADGTIPSKYSTVYTFGDSSIDSGRGLSITTELVNNRDKQTSTSSEESQQQNPLAYTVKRGDNLWTIIKTHYPNIQTNTEISRQVQEVYDANKHQIAHPDLIYPNQTFTLPAAND
ncbi:hypothetical protein CSV77_05845 [Sporosarcina sp. P16b]|uniref:SGNH/GDSL hydrolase family protein n=1 Tax=Sporosarcina sp. P16b TaxID=2048261 RepID=UPI000C172925|nr:SGNH/GDSL hydrolase family protein [Sporosarcina sp. P16b]PIC70831.1 hypothetical protein CSV77_05845 [Sporosarcina sp. P16b]